MTDILIYVPLKYRDETHKDFDEDNCFQNKLHTHPIDKDWEHYWTIPGKPKKVRINRSKVMFTDGKHIIAEGTITDLDARSIYFYSLKTVKKTLPKPAPTRGFTYVD